MFCIFILWHIYATLYYFVSVAPLRHNPKVIDCLCVIDCYATGTMMLPSIVASKINVSL